MTKVTIGQPVRYRYLTAPYGNVIDTDHQGELVLVHFNDHNYRFTRWVSWRSIDTNISRDITLTVHPSGCLRDENLITKENQANDSIICASNR